MPTIIRLFTLSLALLACPAAAFAELAGCPQFFPAGQPPALVSARLAQRATLLCNDAFAVLASGVTHGPLWSAERPTTASLEAARATPRQGAFHPDDRLPLADQAQLVDYSRSGYDRGHMTPSGDMPDEASQQQSFSLANMVPQTAELNRGPWASIETAVRSLAARRGELYLVTGPAFVGQQIKSIGPQGVLVPTSTWKAVYDPQANRTGAYMCSNTAAPHCEVVSVATLAGITGIDPFPAVPDSLKQTAMTLPQPGKGRSPSRNQGQRRREPPSRQCAGDVRRLPRQAAGRRRNLLDGEYRLFGPLAVLYAERVLSVPPARAGGGLQGVELLKPVRHASNSN